jgi:hypothetical protein
MPKHKLNENEKFMIGVFFILVVMSAFLLTGCGKTGSQGATGGVGAPGQAATITESPATALECPTGGVDLTITQNATTAVYSVCNGSAGQSIVGPTGPQGNPGTDATPVTVVQFCSGVTPTYPSNFPEYGICLGGNLYGVYSANDGFLAELPPGEYSSDGINASCTFTIQPNCVVSQ